MDGVKKMKNMPLEEQLYFSKEAADFLGITTQRLNKLVQEGKIHPLKKNASGTIFHIDELNRRREELSIFTHTGNSAKDGLFQLDSAVKSEALNFATLMCYLDYTENKLEPLFLDFEKQVDVSTPLTENIDAYLSFFGGSRAGLINEYEKAKIAFSSLKKTDEIIKRGTADYPSLLAKTKQAPRFLYIRGKKSLLYETRTVALVGSRQASENAKDNTRRLAEKLGENGITIVSGLAKGIDVTAHRAALEYGYNTISVIGTNLNQYYPAENKMVQKEIEVKGLVVSQFSPASKTQRWFFPLRNGVMSGLSLATVIMEAGETSGALKQADFALKQGRQVLIPKKVLEMESITWPAKYVKRGAIVVDKPSDVLRVLANNNIFKINDNEIVKQETLFEYIKQQPNALADNKKGHWIDPVVAEE